MLQPGLSNFVVTHLYAMLNPDVNLERVTLSIWPPRLFLRWEKLNDLSNRLQGVKTMRWWFCLHILGISCDTRDWPAPSNGQISSPCSGNSKVHSGSHCTVACNNGFKIDGPSSSVCGSDGEWDPRTSANCKGKKNVLGQIGLDSRQQKEHKCNTRY